MKKTITAMVILLMAFSASSTGCGKPQDEKIPISETNAKPVETVGKQDNPGKPSNVPNPDENKPGTTNPTETPKEKPPEKPSEKPASSAEVGESTIKPYETSQMLNAMTLVPASAFDITTTENFSAVVYTDVKSTFARMKYDPNKDFEVMLRITPPFMHENYKSPLNDFEKIQNLSWTISSLTNTSIWMAGDFNANMNVPPMLSKEKYKKFPLVYGYNYYKAPDENQNPRYNVYTVPLANSFIMTSTLDATDLARKTAINIADKGKGMHSNPEYAKLLTYLGDPEACVITRNEMGPEKLYEFLEAVKDPSKMPPSMPDSDKMPAELRETLIQSIEDLKAGYARDRKLMYIGIGFYPNETHQLRFILYYENESVAKKDMAKCMEYWNKPYMDKVDTWRKMVGLKETRFSVKENLGFIECKVAARMSGSDVVNNLGIGLTQQAMFVMVKQ